MVQTIIGIEMSDTVYSILNRETKAWWYHKLLRSQGNAKLARKYERKSILSSVRSLRTMSFAQITSQGGFVTYHRPIVTDTATLTCSLSGYTNETIDGIPKAAVRLGIPVVSCENCDSWEVYQAKQYDMSHKELFRSLASVKGARILVDWNS